MLEMNKKIVTTEYVEITSVIRL